MKSNLIVFRGKLAVTSQFGVGKPINFPDGAKGIIRSILDIEVKPTGDVYVIGKYKPLEVSP